MMIGKPTTHVHLKAPQPAIALCRLAVQASALRSARIRAGMDLVVALLVTLAAAQLGETPYDRLLAGTAMLSIAVLVFVFRRGRDLERLALARRWREEAVAGRGMSLSRWRAGERLAGWEARR